MTTVVNKCHSLIYKLSYDDDTMMCHTFAFSVLVFCEDSSAGYTEWVQLSQ